MIQFSLVLGTLGRVRELHRFLESLDAQTSREFELIVVDQNDDNRILPVLKEFEGRFPLLHIRTTPGLSKARNYGLQRAKGKIITFPDDDCWYPPELLEQVTRLWEKEPGWDGMLGQLVWDNTGNDERMGKSAIIPVNIYSATTSVRAARWWQTYIHDATSLPVSSTTMFLKIEVFKAVGSFDPCLGLGSGVGWDAAEDVDLVVRCLKAGFRIGYSPTLKVKHPDPRRGYSDPQQGLRYGAGMGRVLSKHRYPPWFVTYHLLRSLGSALLGVLKADYKRARYHWAVFQGKRIGLSGRPNCMIKH
jgi:glycosyltransferase involved in cell wall biosynthesis